MSKLSKLMGKSKKVVIGGEELELKPLTVDNLDLMMDLENESKRANAMKEIIKVTLKGAVPDATPEEINSVGIEYFKDLSDAIMDVNGLGKE